MNKYRLITCFFLCACLSCFAEKINLDIAGEWQFRLDPENRGIQEKWFDRIFSDHIRLPGALQSQGYGNDVTSQTKWVTNEYKRGLWYSHPMYASFREKKNLRYPNNFQPQKHYVGVAWYKKVIDIGKKALEGEEIILFLERVHWESTLWVNGKKVGKQNSLTSPHIYDISDYIKGGNKLSIVLRVDNRPVVDMGVNAHSWGDQTMTAWNGIVGEMSVKVKEPVHVSDFQIYTNLKDKTARVEYEIKNNLKKNKSIVLSGNIKSFNSHKKHSITFADKCVELVPGVNKLSFSISLTDSVLLWDEYHPNLYRIETTLNEKGECLSHYTNTFGVREIGTHSNRFVLNGKEIYLRGNVLCGSFPMTGYASMDYDAWKRIMTIHKHYGLNHIRFHSWTPPEAAFKAADEVGIYLFPETNAWASIKSDEQATFLLQEGKNNLKYYGNHPSFLMMGMGNELSAKKEITANFLAELKRDGRRVYTGLANSVNSIIPGYDFIVTREIRSTIGWPPAPERSFFYRNKPSTDFLFGNPVKYAVPLITHEAGQHCSYPALDQMQKFTGSQFAGYIDIARKQLEERGMLHLWPNFVKASGKLQSMMYKHELEAYLRMPRHTGYEILQLEDFPGQGSALVGILDYFYDNKGYVTPYEFRRSCAPMALMLKLPKFTWEEGETLTAEACFSNWGEANLDNASICYTIKDLDGTPLFVKEFNPQSIVRGDAVSLGSLSLDLSGMSKATKLIISAYMQGTDLSNEWEVWVYPHSNDADKDKLTIVRDVNEMVVKRIMEGENLVIQLDKNQIRGNMPPVFFPVYWTQFDNMGISQTMGILCNPEHKIFSLFPTEYHTNWQWYDLLRDAHPLVFDEFGMDKCWNKGFIPTIQVIDGWKTNRKLGVLAEARMGKGKVVITSMNLEDSLEHRPSARQFRSSLAEYMNSPYFTPECVISAEHIYALMKAGNTERDEDIISQISFSNIISSSPARYISDDLAKTIWEGEIKEKSIPASIIFSLKKKERIGNININWLKGDKDLSYNVYLSLDKDNWGIPIASGKLLNTDKLDIDLQYFHEAMYVRIDFASSKKLSIKEIKLITD